MGYCPNCKIWVEGKWPTRQKVIFILLLIFGCFLFAFFYLVFFKKEEICPLCREKLLEYDPNNLTTPLDDYGLNNKD